jgi:tripartite-type tricarboxylate transporter receptor subunit TctC
MKRLGAIPILLFFFLFGSLNGSAAEYPQRPVQIIVPFTAGGPIDLVARIMAEAAKPFFPKPISVINKPGGSGIMAVSEVLSSNPDGYNLVAVSISQLFFAPHLQPDIPYKGPDDVQFIISATTAYEVLAVRADSPWKTIQELIAYTKAHPGDIRIGNAGLGTTTHLDALSIKMAGIDMTDVPFAGGAPAVTALLGGHIEGVVLNAMSILPHAQAGKLRFLAILANARSTDVQELKDVPTFKEIGLDVITFGSPMFIVAPKRTPPEVVAIIYNALAKAQQTDLFRNFCREKLLDIDLKGPDQLKNEAATRFFFYRDFIEKKGIRVMVGGQPK